MLWVQLLSPSTAAPDGDPCRTPTPGPRPTRPALNPALLPPSCQAAHHPASPKPQTPLSSSAFTFRPESRAFASHLTRAAIRSLPRRSSLAGGYLAASCPAPEARPHQSTPVLKSDQSRSHPAANPCTGCGERWELKSNDPDEKSEPAHLTSQSEQREADGVNGACTCRELSSQLEDPGVLGSPLSSASTRKGLGSLVGVPCSVESLHWPGGSRFVVGCAAPITS